MKCCNCFITFMLNVIINVSRYTKKKLGMFPNFFFVYLDTFLGIVCCFYSNSKTHELIHLISWTHILIQCVQIHITDSMCTNLYLHYACVCKTYVPLSVCVCVMSLQRM